MFKRVRVGVSRVRSLLIKTMLIIVEIIMAGSKLMDSTDNETSAAIQRQCSMVFLLSLSFGISIGAKNCSENKKLMMGNEGNSFEDVVLASQNVEHHLLRL